MQKFQCKYLHPCQPYKYSFVHLIYIAGFCVSFWYTITTWMPVTVQDVVIKLLPRVAILQKSIMHFEKNDQFYRTQYWVRVWRQKNLIKDQFLAEIPDFSKISWSCLQIKIRKISKCSKHIIMGSLFNTNCTKCIKMWSRQDMG